MDSLRDNLPVIATSAKDVANQIGGAGQTAQHQLDELVSGFERLNDFGAASERQVVSLRKRVDEALAEFATRGEQMGDLTEARFAALNAESEGFRSALDSREVEALASIRTRMQALRDELHEAGETAAEAAAGALTDQSERIDALRADSARIAADLREAEDAALTHWRSQIETLQTRLEDAIAQVTELDRRATDAANAKLGLLRDEAIAIDEKLDERDRAFKAALGERRDALEAAEIESTERMETRLAALDAALAAHREGHIAHLETLRERTAQIENRFAALAGEIDTAAAQGGEAGDLVAIAIAGLSEKLAESREALDGTDMAVAALTDSSVRLLELIQASAKHSRDDLPAAMVASEERLVAIEGRAEAIKALLDEARGAGDGVAHSMAAAGERSRDAMGEVEDFQSRFGETTAAQADAIERLRAGVAALGEESRTLAGEAQDELRSAIAALEDSARQALAAIETDQAERIGKIADTIGTKSGEAIDRAVEEHSAEALARLDEATRQTTATAREATVQLRDQLAKVNELTGNLETRIARARERAEEEVDNDFSRRVALITESLNSNAIDISKAFSVEVADTSWASYLRGDRGIFTRRAVRLIDNVEAREIADLYGADPDFREHVSRYIHDFEAMLRTMLSTRDGNALSVTVLSSDMGKLYVALAQAIERLRN